ncbi:hypothetical protein [Gryllotalpicola protaetiae]|uniref:Uncharacterized protein n=1 Tax=Gryllotalpicola protaetiae TaxID=2419771 RepID=A0A387BQR4_9MICO|nr:hypothetical protein [Gryllotalpicola protaetiae]AYG03429.1 hypothetical protein D7I44_07690 [Gryllotalpicola protaetiae]
MTISLEEARQLIGGDKLVALREIAEILEIGVPSVRQKAYRGQLPIPLLPRTSSGAPYVARAADVLAYVEGHGRADDTEPPEDPYAEPTKSDLELLSESLGRDAATLRRLASDAPEPDRGALRRQADRIDRKRRTIADRRPYARRR